MPSIAAGALVRAEKPARVLAVLAVLACLGATHVGDLDIRSIIAGD